MSPPFVATHTAPEGGLPAWAEPGGGASPVATIDARVEMQVLERRGDWARIVCRNTWSAWVDARKLVSVEPLPPAAIAGASPTPPPVAPPPGPGPKPHPKWLVPAAVGGALAVIIALLVASSGGESDTTGGSAVVDGRYEGRFIDENGVAFDTAVNDIRIELREGQITGVLRTAQDTNAQFFKGFFPAQTPSDPRCLRTTSDFGSAPVAFDGDQASGTIPFVWSTSAGLCASNRPADDTTNLTASFSADLNGDHFVGFLGAPGERGPGLRFRAQRVG